MSSDTNLPVKSSSSRRKPDTPRRLKTKIKHDVVAPADYLKYKLPFACEDCTHFSFERQNCTLGYTSEHHLREVQMKSYLLSGKMALCRFLEID